jgi:6-phosphofructokinase 1
LVLERRFGCMVAKKGEDFVPVPLKEVAGQRRSVPLDHPLIRAARAVKTCLGDRVVE